MKRQQRPSTSTPPDMEFRIRCDAALDALRCACAGDPNSLETALNRGTARIHAIAALRMLPDEVVEQIFAKDAPS